MARIHSAMLALPFALLIQGCPSSKSKPGTAGPMASDDAQDGSASTAPSLPLGLNRFQCAIEAATPLQGECTIEKLSNGKIQFLMPLPQGGKLSGELVPTDFGYQFSGQLETASKPSTALGAQLFDQGKGSFAAVLPIPGQRPWQLTLTPFD